MRGAEIGALFAHANIHPRRAEQASKSYFSSSACHSLPPSGAGGVNDLRGAHPDRANLQLPDARNHAMPRRTAWTDTLVCLKL